MPSTTLYKILPFPNRLVLYNLGHKNCSKGDSLYYTRTNYYMYDKTPLTPIYIYAGEIF